MKNADAPAVKREAAQPDSEQFRSSPRTLRTFWRMIPMQLKNGRASATCAGGRRLDGQTSRRWAAKLKD
jgi:hypothetical protein